jgi:microcystin degradation protein MlrC
LVSKIIIFTNTRFSDILSDILSVETESYRPKDTAQFGYRKHRVGAAKWKPFFQLLTADDFV